MLRRHRGSADGTRGEGGEEDLIIGLENEHACNIGTAVETARVLDAAQHPNLRLVWDPANALVAGENPFPYGYGLLQKDRIAHVHTKDCHMEGHRPIWGPLGTRSVDWKGQLAALMADGYNGWLSLETHWPGPDGDKMAASTICGWNLRGLAAMSGLFQVRKHMICAYLWPEMRCRDLISQMGVSGATALVRLVVTECLRAGPLRYNARTNVCSC
jgi:hypothetical protein